MGNLRVLNIIFGNSLKYNNIEIETTFKLNRQIDMTHPPQKFCARAAWI